MVVKMGLVRPWTDLDFEQIKYHLLSSIRPELLNTDTTFDQLYFLHAKAALGPVHMGHKKLWNNHITCQIFVLFGK